MPSDCGLAAFIEGFGYALAPMLALVVTLGPIGIAAAGKFLKLLIWIQLWMPALAVVNLFTYLGVSAELSAIQDTQGLAITSLTGVEQFDAVVQPWLGTAGMMAAAVPALTLMVVWGGAVAMNGLAQRLQGRSLGIGQHRHGGLADDLDIQTVRQLHRQHPLAVVQLDAHGAFSRKYRA